MESSSLWSGLAASDSAGAFAAGKCGGKLGKREANQVRVSCETINGEAVEGEVIGGEPLAEGGAEFDLDSTFTVRCDDGACFQVHGWLVDVTVLCPETIQ